MEALTTQRSLILAHMKRRGSITQKEAYELYDCFRLGARIYDLRRSGIEIATERVTDLRRKNYARYRIII